MFLQLEKYILKEVSEMYLKEFKEELLNQEKSKNTIDGYIRDIQSFIHFYKETTGESYTPVEINSLDVREFKGYLQNVKRQHPKTINHKLPALRKYFDFLMDINITEKNPTNGIKRIEFQRERSVEIIEDNDLYRFKRKVYADENKRDIAIFEIFNNAGIRVSELCAIHLEDVKFTEGHKKANLVIYMGKGSKYRELPLNNDARKAILNYLEVRPKCSFPNLFIGERGPLTRAGVYKILKKYGYQARLEGIHPHMLRHKFGHKLIVQGFSESSAADLLGHGDINSTRIYTMATQKDKERAVEYSRINKEVKGV